MFDINDLDNIFRQAVPGEIYPRIDLRVVEEGIHYAIWDYTGWDGFNEIPPVRVIGGCRWYGEKGLKEIRAVAQAWADDIENDTVTFVQSPCGNGAITMVTSTGVGEIARAGVVTKRNRFTIVSGESKFVTRKLWHSYPCRFINFEREGQMYASIRLDVKG